MTNSLELYKEALTLAKNNPMSNYGFRTVAGDALRNFYLQLVTTIFYELTTRKTSPLISALCQMNRINYASKNFTNLPMQQTFNWYTSYDMFMLIYGLNVALAENLSSCLKVFENNAAAIFRGQSLKEEDFQALTEMLTMLDESLGKFCGSEKIVEKRVEAPVEEKSFTPDEEDKTFLQSLNTLANNRLSDDEKILTEIKTVQRDLQEELPRLEETLKKISDIRDGIEFKTLEEPIEQLLQLFDKIHETLQQHPQSDAQKGYEKLLKRCRNFSRFVEQSLAMLGAELINETNIPLDLAKHMVTNVVRPSYSAKVSKILSVGLIYKGQVRRKAEVEVVEPAATLNNASRLGKFFGR